MSKVVRYRLATGKVAMHRVVSPRVVKEDLGYSNSSKGSRGIQLTRLVTTRLQIK